MKLGKALFYEQPTKYIVGSEFYNNSYKTPVLTAGKSFILGYTNETNGIYNNLPCIIFDDFTTDIKYVDFPFKVKSSAMKILTTNNENNLRYLYYFLSTIKLDTELHKRYWISKYAELNVKLHLFPEQKQIATELDEVYGAIEKQKKQLELCDILIKSKFNEMFGDPVKNDKGWDEKNLNEICDVRDGTHDSPKYVSEGYPLITSKNVSSGFLDFSQVNLISKKDYDNINKRSKVDFGDILMPMIGTIGNPIIVNIKPFFAIKNMALIKFNKTNIINIYILSLLSSEFLKIKANDQMKGGTQKFMSLGTIRALKIPIPPLPLQQQFADFVNEVEQNKAKIKQSLNETETLYKALMQKYFDKGENL